MTVFFSASLLREWLSEYNINAQTNNKNSIISKEWSACL